MKCPSCDQDLTEGYVYVRGFGASLHWGERSDVSWFSRKGLEMIDLRDYSLLAPRTQARVRGRRCRGCGALLLLRRSTESLTGR